MASKWRCFSSGCGCCRCARPSPRPVLVAVEALAPGAVGAEAEQLAGLEGGDLEEAGAGAVEHHREQPAELILDRGQLPDQRRAVDGQPGAVDHRQRDRLEELDPFAGEERNPCVAGRLPGDLRNCWIRSRSRATCFLHRPGPGRAGAAPARRTSHPVLDLDEILAAGAVARLQLEIAGDDPVLPGRTSGQPRRAARSSDRPTPSPSPRPLPVRSRVSRPRRAASQKKTGSR